MRLAREARRRLKQRPWGTASLPAPTEWLDKRRSGKTGVHSVALSTSSQKRSRMEACISEDGATVLPQHAQDPGIKRTDAGAISKKARTARGVKSLGTSVVVEATHQAPTAQARSRAFGGLKRSSACYDLSRTSLENLSDGGQATQSAPKRVSAPDPSPTVPVESALPKSAAVDPHIVSRDIASAAAFAPSSSSAGAAPRPAQQWRLRKVSELVA